MPQPCGPLTRPKLQGMNTAVTPGHQDPASFPRRILLAVSGLSPQIVTETIYALAAKPERNFVPTEVHLITTREGAQRAALSNEV